jgi:IclR family transcriptional regulator, acetate operon repressor
MAVTEVRSVMTALRVLDEIAAREPVGVSELARVLELPKSSVQRTLRTLHSAGWIHPIEAEMTRWSLTTHMLRIGQRAAGGLNLRDAAVPVMERLRSATQETVHLTVSEADKVILIERLDSPQAVRTFIPLGMAVPIYASANGKAILATRSYEEVGALVRAGLAVHTPKTITDEDALQAQLGDVRRLGYAVNDEEWRSGVSAVAAAVVADDGTAVAGLSISTPSHRMSGELQGRYGELLKEAVREISQTLGHRR